MLVTRLNEYHPSLRRWTRAFVAVWLIGAVIMAPVAVSLLEQINNDASSTYTREIPSLLDRDRKAIKLERLSSFISLISAVQDPRVERHFLLQFQALSQGFDLDNDPGLNETVARAGANLREILAIHAALRRLGRDGHIVGEADLAAAQSALEEAAHKASEEAIGRLNSATDQLTTGSALTADSLANRIQQNALWIERGSLITLAIFVASGVLILWFFHRHVLAPIRIAVQGLEVIRGSDGAPVTLPRSLFFELDVIGRAVEQYARFAAELRTANLNLRTLSSQDGLTGVTNRRGFDLALEEACREAKGADGTRSLLLIDVDYFKSLNDRFGHLAGDRCLRTIAETLHGVCEPQGGLVSRYGGEEFAVLVPNLDLVEVQALAESLRAAVERTPLEVGASQHRLNVTVSVGGVSIGSATECLPERAIRAADQALYKAKREGRNRVCLAPLSDEPMVDARSAA